MSKLYRGIKAGLKDALAGRYTTYEDEPIDVQALREGLGLTQEKFSQRFGIPLGSLRNWEQGHRIPGGAICSYLRVIEKNPRAVLQALT